MNLNCKYGYKVCYTELGKSRIKVFLVTNTFDSALWNVRWYEREPPKTLKDPKWQIHEIKTKNEYEKLWKGCPFKDDLS